jgi:hypothetical protein
LKKNTKMKIYKTMIRPVVTCWLESWTVTAKDENNLRIFEKQILSKIFILYSFSVHVVTYKLCHQLHALFSFIITFTLKNSSVKMSVTQITLDINIEH